MLFLLYSFMFLRIYLLLHALHRSSPPLMSRTNTPLSTVTTPITTYPQSSKLNHLLARSRSAAHPSLHPTPIIYIIHQTPPLTHPSYSLLSGGRLTLPLLLLPAARAACRRAIWWAGACVSSCSIVGGKVFQKSVHHKPKDPSFQDTHAMSIVTYRSLLSHLPPPSHPWAGRRTGQTPRRHSRRRSSHRGSQPCVAPAAG